jgi:hypothetical protein
VGRGETDCVGLDSYDPRIRGSGGRRVLGDTVVQPCGLIRPLAFSSSIS